MLSKPADVFDRDREWADLDEFASSEVPGLRLGIVYGRRRQGKSYLLRRLARLHRGRYLMALEEERTPALHRVAATIADSLGWPPGQLHFPDWPAALGAALSKTGAPAADPARTAPTLLVIDEFPYLLQHSPELPSVLQELVDRLRDAPAPIRLVLCGSAFAVMSELLSGTRALRGRASLDLLLRPFDFRLAAGYWGAGNPDVALHLDAILGGTPGYRDLIDAPAPASVDELADWLAASVLNPSHALFGEAEYLLREDPRVTDRALYHSVLAAIAAGSGTPASIGARIGRRDRALAHPLQVLRTAGFIVRDDDVLLQRRPTLRIADPIVRFHQLITVPRIAQFEERRARQAWEAAVPAFTSGVLGPHFEQLARDWTSRYAAATTTGGPIGEVGRTVVTDRAARAVHELDVVALAGGQRRHDRRARVRVLGEAKASGSRRGTGDLARLDRVCDVLAERGVRVDGARLLLFGRAGFDSDLFDASRRRSDVELVDLERLYSGD